MSDRKPLIAGNWKMNLDHQQAIALVQKVAWTLKDVDHDFEKVEVAVFPPFTDLRTVQTLIDADKLQLRLGAQDISKHDSGAYTGEVAGSFLKKLDVEYVLVGHSERRENHSEDDDLIRDKVAACFKNKLVPLICVGETLEQLEAEGAAAAPIEQLTKALEGHKDIGDFVVAYEPVWAIGTGKVATNEQAAEVAKKLRETIGSLISPEVAEQTRILYGGSVKSSNVAGFLASSDVDGVLVGGASLVVDEFTGICRFQKHVRL
jgi:triosephosphate isomerase